MWTYILKKLEELKVYIKFCSNFHQAQVKLNELSENREFQAFLQVSFKVL